MLYSCDATRSCSAHDQQCIPALIFNFRVLQDHSRSISIAPNLYIQDGSHIPMFFRQMLFRQRLSRGTLCHFLMNFHASHAQAIVFNHACGVRFHVFTSVSDMHANPRRHNMFLLFSTGNTIFFVFVVFISSFIFFFLSDVFRSVPTSSRSTVRLPSVHNTC